MIQKLDPLTQSKFFVVNIFRRAIIENNEKISDLNSKKVVQLGLTDSDPQLESGLGIGECQSPKGDSGQKNGAKHILNEVIN
jgi:hypothetical protein